MKTDMLKAVEQQRLLKRLEAIIRQTTESEFPDFSARLMETSIQIDPLQPQGYKVMFRISMQLSELDKKINEKLP